VDRREFLKAAGAGVAAASLGTPSVILGADGAPVDAGHLVPRNKNLPRTWLNALRARGSAHVYRGEELDAIGMPVGGIAAGQVYLLGDGRLGCWEIFNRSYFSGFGSESYPKREPATPVDQGFAVEVEVDGTKARRRLDRWDFPDVTFTGEYPIGLVRYRDSAFPVAVEMEAFSPFVPLDAENSTLPVTLFHITLSNTSARAVEAAVVGWLENAVCRYTLAEVALSRTTARQVSADGPSWLHHGVRLDPEPQTAPRSRPAIVLADFEGPDYGDWSVEGDAFGRAPATGVRRRQGEVTGFLGKGLVNTFADPDLPRGTLTSPAFPVNRRYLNFLVGGGSREGETCINLSIDGEIVRTATGRNDETLTWRSWQLAELQGRWAHIQIVDGSRDGWGHVSVDHIELADERRLEPGPLAAKPDYGSMALAYDGVAVDEEPSDVVASRPHRLAPGEKRTFTFAVAWHFANLGDFAFRGLKRRRYAARFADAKAVALYVLANQQRLTRDTRKWHECFYGGTLPRWCLHRIHSTVANLATGLCYWQEDGRFWAWEGVGCCSGTCTHVWSYAQALARLFPEVERSVREQQDLGAALQADGMVRYRGETSSAGYAADGQLGTVLKCYREHQTSADGKFLERTWARIRRVLEYSLERDGNGDGVIEDGQRNTYDISFHGANTYVGSLYLAALRAGEEMARIIGDGAFAARLREIFESGRRAAVDRLWNGEYFVQQVDLARHPRHQYADGCLSDQLFGQAWAHQLGLGHLYPEAIVEQALESIWTYNWAPDVGPHNAVHAPDRRFADAGEAGLFVCTWPRSRHLGHRSLRYRDEVWTGIEYQVAAHMIWVGMVEQGLAVMRAVHDRYQPSKRNPYNEVECGDHYSRALASWGAYLALCGFEYDGPRGYIAFAPRLHPNAFRAAFTAAEGWGTFSQERSDGVQDNTLSVAWGRVAVRSLVLAMPEAFSNPRAEVMASGAPLAAQFRTGDGRLRINLEDRVTLGAGDELRVKIRQGTHPSAARRRATVSAARAAP
jgi:uncharacterized protein (DUF608 family)